jgi:DNA-binding transcriptional LysR family regulator
MDLLSQMETFVRMAETGSLSAAARARSLSLPAVSRQLRALERDLGSALVIRSTRRLRLTDAGQRWYANCLRILRDLEAARADVSASNAPRGTLTVSMPVSLGLVVVMPRVHALLARHNELSVNVRMEDHIVDMVSDAVDVVVRGGIELPDTTSFISRPLLQFRRIPVASPAYLRRHGMPRDPETLARHECLVQLAAQGLLDEWEFLRGEETRTVRVSGRLRATPLALLEAALAGHGIALLPQWLVDRDAVAGRLKAVAVGWQTPPTTVWALYRAEARSAARVRAFVDAMTDPR